MKVLVACEESQRVCKEFRKLGHEAYSCDIEPCSGGHPEWHVQGDALDVLHAGSFMTADGAEHYIKTWDLMIAHPPCTYLSNVATRSFSLRCSPAEKVCERWKLRGEAAVFFMQLMLAPVERIAVENPVGFMNTAFRKADQIISPYMFSKGEADKQNFVTKRTCLWLKNLPKLEPTYHGSKPDNAAMYGVTPSGKTRVWEDSFSRSAKIRSKTFPGIARAMAEQWGGINTSIYLFKNSTYLCKISQKN